MGIGKPIDCEKFAWKAVVAAASRGWYIIVMTMRQAARLHSMFGELGLTPARGVSVFRKRGCTI